MEAAGYLAKRGNRSRSGANLILAMGNAAAANGFTRLRLPSGIDLVETEVLAPSRCDHVLHAWDPGRIYHAGSFMLWRLLSSFVYSHRIGKRHRS
jgi:hypothetical protein